VIHSILYQWGDSVMRVIAGTLRGRKIKTIRGDRTRPTSDKVRESMFNVIGPHVVGARVLDLYAGSGAIGIEALSRGATYGVFVEKSRYSSAIIKHNLEELGLAEYGAVYMIDVIRAIEKFSREKSMFDIIFSDAPYVKKTDDDPERITPNQNLLQNIDNLDVLVPNGLVVIEHFKRDLPDYFGEKISFVQAKTYGDTSFSVYKNAK